MRQLLLFSKETPNEKRARHLKMIRRTSTPIAIESNINHIYIELDLMDSIAVGIGKHLMTIKNVRGVPIVKLLTDPRI
jgi:hypothetical protein